jgi:DNA-binding response OmpR family regulator
MGHTILVIDDDEAVLRSYGRLLGRLGHTIRLEGDVEAARQDPGLLDGVDLLILDHRMPGMSGIDFLSALRRRSLLAARGPAVILISAFLTEDLRLRATRLGVTEVIEKPVNPTRLVASVRAVLATLCEGEAAAGGGARRSGPGIP